MPKANDSPLEELKERTMVNRPRFSSGRPQGLLLADFVEKVGSSRPPTY